VHNYLFSSYTEHERNANSLNFETDTNGKWKSGVVVGRSDGSKAGNTLGWNQTFDMHAVDLKFVLE
jgi:hypothetical protein